MMKKLALAGVLIVGAGYSVPKAYKNIVEFNEVQRQIAEIAKLKPQEALNLDMYCSQKGVTMANIQDSVKKVKAKIKL